MDHNLKLSTDMDQALAAFRDRWIRSRALSAAVEFHVGNDEPYTVKTVLDTSDEFVKYILIGRELSHAPVQ